MSRIHEIFFVSKKAGTCLLHHGFMGSMLDSQLVSGFLSAISSFLNFIMPNKDVNNIIRMVDRGDFKILVEPGKEIIGLLLCKSDSTSLRKKLRECIKLFEEIYDLSDTTAVDISQFEPYKEMIVKKFASELINLNDIPVLSEDFIDKSTLELLLAIDNSSDIQEISNRLNEQVDTVIEKMAYLQELGIIRLGDNLASKVNNTDIFTLTDEGLNVFDKFSYVYETIYNTYGSDGVDVLKLMKDGKISINGINLKTNINLDKIKEIISFAMKEGWLTPVRIYPKLITSENIKNWDLDSDLSEIFNNIINYCDGRHSLREISKKMKLPETVLASFLDKMGADIEWIRK